MFRKLLTTSAYAMLCCTIGLLCTHKAQAQIISLQNSSLVYTNYANQGETNAVNKIPDFSFAGYKGGGVTLPNVTTIAETITPVEGDNRLNIQNAIDRIAARPLDANGYRGVLLLKAGVYPVNGTLTITSSGIILRGEGNSVTGTVIIETRDDQGDLIQFNGTGSGYAAVAGSLVRLTDTYLPTGATSITVEAGHNFVAGDTIVIQKTPNQAWIDTLDMAQYGWTADAYKLVWQRKVLSVTNNTLVLDIPIVDPLQEKYGGANVYKSRTTGYINSCAVENMRLESTYKSADDEEHGWRAIVLNRVEHSWVKDVVGKYFGYSTVSYVGSQFITVQDCAMVDPKSQTTGGRKYSFSIDGNTTSVLTQRCYAWGGRHDFVTGARIPGPNVFMDCLAENTKSDAGPHHRYATGTLYDNIKAGQMNAQNRKDLGTGHGWAGVQQLFYNCQATSMIVENPKSARNWVIGTKANSRSGNAYVYSSGTAVQPRSLYIQQLEERLGTQAVQNVTIPTQLNSKTDTVYTYLKNKYGDIVNETKVDIDFLGLIDYNKPVITAQYLTSTKPEESYTSLFDNTAGYKFYQANATSMWIQSQFSNKTLVTNYSITSANDVATRDPKNWRLLGSDDGTTWTAVDIQNAQSFASRNLTKTYLLNNPANYKYYRLDITANNGAPAIQFAEWELFAGVVPQKKFTGLIDAGSNDISAQYSNTNAAENIASLVDNTDATKYYISGKTALWVQHSAPAAISVNSYCIASANDQQARDPKNWQLLGSSDGTNWTVVDSQTDQVFNERKLTRYFALSTTATYQYFRLNVLENKGAAGTQFAEWELFGKKLETQFIGLIDNGDTATNVTAQYNNTTNPAQTFKSLVDNLSTTKFFVSGRPALWVQYQAPDTITVEKYIITAGNDVPGRDPKNWTLQGSNNGTSWTTVDTRTNQGGASVARNSTTTYTLGSPARFIYFRLNITAIEGSGGATGVQFSEWELYGVAKKDQNITFPSIANKNTSDPDFNLNVTNSSGLPVSYNSSDNTVATVAPDGTVSIEGEGSTIITASNLGNDTTNSATVSQTLQVGSVILPVTWLYFTAARNANQIAVNWATASEINAKAYDVERSFDGSTFGTIGWVAARGSSSSQSSYSFTDIHSDTWNIGVVYYRIKQADRDGKITYSATVAVRLTGVSGSEKVMIYPNPFVNELKVHIENAAITSNAGQVTIYTMDGKIVYQKKIENVVNNSFITLNDVGLLKPGVYTLKLRNGNRAVQSFKIIKK